MTSFTLSNMDYAPLKFMIKIFEANYPESLGAVLVHKAPWVFQGIWAIVKGWLDPVVAAKVHFTKSVDDLEVFIDRASIVKELGGKEDWVYRYVEPAAGENDAMKDSEARRRLEDERRAHVAEFQDVTFKWLLAKKGADDERVNELAAQRDQLARTLNANYWALDPMIRARSLLDRQGVIGPAGVIDFYPKQRGGGGAEGQASRPETQATVNGVLPKSHSLGVSTSASANPNPDPSADDLD
jgi:CRAL/TRIO domain